MFCFRVFFLVTEKITATAPSAGVLAVQLERRVVLGECFGGLAQTGRAARGAPIGGHMASVYGLRFSKHCAPGIILAQVDKRFGAQGFDGRDVRRGRFGAWLNLFQHFVETSLVYECLT